MSRFYENVTNLWGDEGREWLDSLPALVDEIAVKWSLTGLKPLQDLSYNYVLAGTRKGEEVVLKVGFDAISVEQEMKALKFYKGIGSVKILDVDLRQGALLLEKVIPAVPLRSLFPEEDELAVSHAVKVMKRLHSVPLTDASGFPRVGDWLRLLDETEACSIPETHLKRAKSLASRLLGTAGEPVLLHGDLHHENILLSETREDWLAIDPKGVIGEPVYEVGAFIRNPYPYLLDRSDVSQITSHRLDLFADYLDLDRHRLKEWSYVQAILAACWAVDEKHASCMISIAELIEHIK